MFPVPGYLPAPSRACWGPPLLALNFQEDFQRESEQKTRVWQCRTPIHNGFCDSTQSLGRRLGDRWNVMLTPWWPQARNRRKKEHTSWMENYKQHRDRKCKSFMTVGDYELCLMVINNEGMFVSADLGLHACCVSMLAYCCATFLDYMFGFFFFRLKVFFQE